MTTRQLTSRSADLCALILGHLPPAGDPPVSTADLVAQLRRCSPVYPHHHDVARMLRRLAAAGEIGALPRQPRSRHRYWQQKEGSR